MIEHLHAHVWPDVPGLLLESMGTRIENLDRSGRDPAAGRPHDVTLVGWWDFRVTPTRTVSLGPDTGMAQIQEPATRPRLFSVFLGNYRISATLIRQAVDRKALLFEAHRRLEKRQQEFGVGQAVVERHRSGPRGEVLEVRRDAAAPHPVRILRWQIGAWDERELGPTLDELV